MVKIIQKGVTDKKSFHSLKAMIVLEVRGHHSAVYHGNVFPGVFSTPGFFSNKAEVDKF